MSASTLNQIHDELWDIPNKAARLPWAEQSKWTFSTHIKDESGDDGTLYVVDLHDLSVPLARNVVSKSIKVFARNHVGMVCFITGQGKHSEEGPKILPMTMEVVTGLASRKGWEVRTEPGRVLVVLNVENAPKVGSNELSRTMVWGMYAFFAILGAILLRALLTV